VRGAAVAALVAALGAIALVLLAPGEIGRNDVGRETNLSSVSSPSLTGGLSMPTSAPSQSVPGARLADVLRDPGVPATKGDALAVLQGLWGMPAAGGQPDCERPVSGALECLTAVGTWQKLRRLDLPAVLELAAPGGERRYGVLTSLTPSEATLRFGDRVVTALLPEVEPFWNGGFVLLWRPPPGELPVRRGARGPATDWLRERMARASGQPAEPGLPYDQALWERVTAFQQARSLEPDGVVGHETAIVLRGAEWGPEVPRLAAGAR
jgi:general secretion pathway protein A